MYNRIGKKPVLAIEVDGYEYHKDGTVQASRDLLKNHILELCEIPLLRFKTNGSGEKEKIIEMLERMPPARYYKNTYLEICEVLDELVEVSLFSSEDDPYEIYFSFGIMYGIVYAEKETAYEKREQMKADLEQEYFRNKKPSREFISSFTKKYDVCLPSDTLFDEGALMDAFMNI